MKNTELCEDKMQLGDVLMPQEVLAYVTSTAPSFCLSDTLSIPGYISARLQDSVKTILLPHHGRNCRNKFGTDEIKTLIQPSMDNIHLTSF